MRVIAVFLLAIDAGKSYCWASLPHRASPLNLPVRSAQTNDFVTSSDDYQWPANLYIEMRDMAAASFLVYAFAYIADAAREVGLKGLEVSDQGKVGMPSRDLGRCFSPKEILTIVEDNREVLKEKFDFAFGDTAGYEMLIQNLKTFQERSTASELDRPLTLEEFDDKHQEHEMVYGVCKDDVNKRITLVFRGTENELAMQSNWSTNFNMVKEQADVPDIVKEVVPDGIGIHKGFLSYVFSPTKDETDHSEFRKYDEILEDVKILLKQNPAYKLYVTGHSLGAALSTLVSFYLACDPDIPKPVTCISFASPRLGDLDFLKATQYLEEQKLLRMVRAVNDNDSVAFFPVRGYHHVGFQVRLYKNAGKPPVISYPQKSESFGQYVSRLWGNSLLRSFNAGYDHGDYRQRVDKDQSFLEAYDLNALYSDTSLTGFDCRLS